ncbi:hypothetical protein N181_02190 [Sinorhizobium fredii USDA 205]|nr:hypothetical protein N181_02190 [Sinorhizobium fredii USDA 205]
MANLSADGSGCANGEPAALVGSLSRTRKSRRRYPFRAAFLNRVVSVS